MEESGCQRKGGFENVVFYNVKMHVEKTLKCRLLVPCLKVHMLGKRGRKKREIDTAVPAFSM